MRCMHISKRLYIKLINEVIKTIEYYGLTLLFVRNIENEITKALRLIKLGCKYSLYSEGIKHITKQKLTSNKYYSESGLYIEANTIYKY